jgi:hypothetical protein
MVTAKPQIKIPMNPHTPTGKAPVMYVKPYSAKDLANIYGVAKKTMNKWLEPFAHEIGPKKGRYYTVVQVKIIFHRIGLPGTVDE